jgi:preprotein translocase subunit SecD
MFHLIRSASSIVLLVIGSVYFSSWTVTLRERADGVMRDTSVTRVPLKKGLDLQGGMHLALELDQSKQVSADPKRDLDLALTVLRKRIDEFGVEEPLVQKAGDSRIVVELAGVTEPGRAKAIVQRSVPGVPHHRQDQLAGEGPSRDGSRCAASGSRAHTTRASPRSSSSGRRFGKEAASDSAKKAAAGRPAERQDHKDSTSTDSASSAGGGILQGLIQSAGQVAGTNTPGEYVVPEPAFPRVDSLINLAAVARQLPRGVVLRWSSAPTSIGVQPYRFLYALDDRPIVTGSNLEDAQATIDQLTQGAIVTFQLDRAGGRKFGEETGRHVGDFMAILLDGRVQGRPVTKSSGRNGQIPLGNRNCRKPGPRSRPGRRAPFRSRRRKRQVGASLERPDSGRITAGVSAPNRAGRSCWCSVA